MRILLVGNTAAPRAALSELFAGGSLTVTHCAGGSSAIAELRKGWWSYDWIVLGSRETLKEVGQIVSVLETFGMPVPVGLLDTQGSASPTLSLICVIRSPASGFQLLRCALAAPGAVRIDYRSHGREEVIFEYRGTSQKGGESARPVVVIQEPTPAFAAERISRA